MPEYVRLDTAAASNGKPVVMLLAMDMRTMYSDGLNITANQGGMVLNFTQATNQPQPSTIASIGMSHQQAEQVLRALQQAVLATKYLPATKLLPPPQT